MEIDHDKLLLKIESAKKGEQAAFSFLLDSYWLYVYNFLLVRTNNEEDAEDICIQTFSKAFDKIETYNTDFKFATWLLAISKNVHIDFLRKRKSVFLSDTTKEQQEQAYKVIDSSPTPEDKIIKEQNLASLLLDIKKMKPKYQEIINLRFFQELSYKEIAEHTNEPMSNVKVKLLRAKKILANHIRNRKI